MSEEKVKKLVEYLKVNDFYDEAVELTEYYIIPFEEREYIGTFDGFPICEKYAKIYTTFIGKRVCDGKIINYYEDDMQSKVLSVRDKFEVELMNNPKLYFLVSSYFKFNLKKERKSTIKSMLKELRDKMKNEESFDIDSTSSNEYKRVKKN